MSYEVLESRKTYEGKIVTITVDKLRLLGVGCILGGAMLAEMSGKKTRTSFSE